MFNALRKLFGCSAKSEKSSNTSCCKSGASLEGFVEYVVKSLVDAPELVKISTEDNANNTIIRIDCKKEDIGKIVGKKGKTIMAIRSLVRGAAGKMNKLVTVEVND